MSWWWYAEKPIEGSEADVEAERNVTYNVSGMLAKAFDCEVRELSGLPVEQLGPRVMAALERIAADPPAYRAMAPANGWGTFDSFLDDVIWLGLLAIKHPGCVLRIS